MFMCLNWYSLITHKLSEWMNDFWNESFYNDSKPIEVKENWDKKLKLYPLQIILPKRYSMNVGLLLILRVPSGQIGPSSVQNAMLDVPRSWGPFGLPTNICFYGDHKWGKIVKRNTKRNQFSTITFSHQLPSKISYWTGRTKMKMKREEIGILQFYIIYPRTPFHCWTNAKSL